MSLLRSFIAIEIPTEIKQAISAQTANLQKQIGSSVRWVAAENIHLTLKFLGEISPTNVDVLSQMLQAECEHHPPFTLTIHSLGCFPNPRHARVIWIGVDCPQELIRLQREIESTTARLGYAPEDKPFSAHLTIGRVREQATATELQIIKSVIEDVRIDQLGTFTARSVELFKSDLKPAGPVYSRLFSAPLGN
jgi:2'-5' RNA ligase